MLVWALLWGSRVHAQDLLIDGTTVELSGLQVFDTVRITNGGVLRVAPFSGAPGTGTLELVADLVFIDAASRIDGRGAGHPGAVDAAGTGPGGGGSGPVAGGGGGHGGEGRGGNVGTCIGPSGAGGMAHGSLDALSEPGSAGGAPQGSGVAGGAGGGSVLIDARVLDLRGRIEVDGADGPVSAAGAGAGGGAGGGIVLFADALYCDGILSARGGDGGIGTLGHGGAGGGGRIEQWSDAVHQPCAALVDPGRSGCGPLASPGADDAVAESDFDADGTSAQAGDCDSADPDVFPLALEICDAVDNDCDGAVDEGTVCTGCTSRSPADRVYQYCAAAVSWEDASASCASMGYTLADVASAGENTNLGNNGDSVGVSEFWIGYNDLDTEGVYTWESGASYTYTNWESPPDPLADCAVFRNNNRWEALSCDSLQAYACEACDVQRHYLDADGDGRGDRSTERYTCQPLTNELLDGSDCDDSSAARFPGAAADPCDGIDADCDGEVDEACTCVPRTHDGHDYLLCTSALPFDAARAFCERQGMSLATLDDAEEDAWLDAEIDALSPGPWYMGLWDEQRDGSFAWLFGGSAYTNFDLAEPNGLPLGAACAVLNNPTASPGRWEDELCTVPRPWVCEEMVGCVPSLWYIDGDGDGHGDSATALASCKPIAGRVPVGDDCDDANASRHPGAVEIPADGLDQDCSGGDRCFRDLDGDGYGSAITIDTSTDLDCADPGESARSDDCNDAGPVIHPGGTETCGDGIDSDCDGQGGPLDDEDDDGLPWVAEGALGGSDCTADSDGDGILDPTEYLADPADHDSDNDSIADLVDDDDDGDGIPTALEGVGHGEQSSECQNPDDGLPNYLDLDSDGDLLPDAVEGTGNADQDAFPDFLDCIDGCTTDLDGDGLQLCAEIALGTDPALVDSDGDGVDDGLEVGSVQSPRDTDGDTVIDALDLDDDGDLVPTSLEDRDGDGDPTDDDLDGDELADYLDPDDDGDGTLTRLEDRDGDGDPTDDDLDGDELADYLDAVDTDGPLGDPDGDGLVNQLEGVLGADPMDFDSDGDGLEDGAELGDPVAPTDTDRDGQPDLVDPDDDGDTLPTAEEGQVDIDGDGLPNHLDLDSDNDGVPDGPDGLGDADCDGLVDAWDAHDNDLCDGAAQGGQRVYEGQGCSCDLASPGGRWLPMALGLALLARRARAGQPRRRR